MSLDVIKYYNIIYYKMKSIVTSIFAALLFIALTPGVLLRLPPKGGKWTVLIVHALVFFVIYYLTHGLVYRYFNPSMRQGFENKKVRGGKKVSFSDSVKNPDKHLSKGRKMGK
mgnify:CR=1 FL=1